MERLYRCEEMTAWSMQEVRAGQTIGLVPTMGFLHEGHLSLMRRLRPLVDRLVVSIYVNPLQFGAHEDLDTYPTDLEGDAAKCETNGVDALFIPASLYPDGFSTSISVHRLTDGLCGAARPGHFEGVATVVTRLFGVVRCHKAIFGEKDFQQLCVLRRMTKDLALGVEIYSGSIVREEDGLAMSSRNSYLSASERNRALSLSGALRDIRRAYLEGETDARALERLGKARLKVDKTDYLSIVEPDTLTAVDKVDAKCQVLVAAWVGNTRLIDNMSFA